MSNENVASNGNKPGDNSSDEETEMDDKISTGHLEYLYPEPLIKTYYDLCLVLINEPDSNINLDDNNANNIATSRDVNKVINDKETNTQNTLLVTQHAKCVTEIAETRFNRA